MRTTDPSRAGQWSSYCKRQTMLAIRSDWMSYTSLSFSRTSFRVAQHFEGSASTMVDVTHPDGLRVADPVRPAVGPLSSGDGVELSARGE